MKITKTFLFLFGITTFIFEWNGIKAMRSDKVKSKACSIGCVLLLIGPKDCQLQAGSGKTFHDCESAGGVPKSGGTVSTDCLHPDTMQKITYCYMTGGQKEGEFCEYKEDCALYPCGYETNKSGKKRSCTEGKCKCVPK